jgi:repressor LexA
VSSDDRTSRQAPHKKESATTPSTRRRGGTRTAEPQLRAVAPMVGAAPDLVSADLTARQGRILEFIREWVEQYGYPPSVREIGEAVGLVSPSSVAYQLKELERKG